MIPITAIYGYLHNLSREKRQSDLAQLLSLFTEAELTEVEAVLAQARTTNQARIIAYNQAHGPLKVSLTT